MPISQGVIAETVSKLYERSVKILPRDRIRALEKALERETNAVAKETLSTIIENIKLAEETNSIICTDTGLPSFFITVGLKGEIDGDVRKAVEEGTKRVTRDLFLVSHCVHPLTRVNSGTNVGDHAPVIYYDVKCKSDCVEITAVPVSAVETFCRFKVFDLTEDVRTIKEFIIKAASNAGGICPPLTIGVGLGGTFSTAGKLATLACMRNLEVRNPDPEIASMEEELLEKINRLGIGPMNLGGDTTALAVNIEVGHTHSVPTPVAVRAECWNNRHASARIGYDGEVVYY